MNGADRRFWPFLPRTSVVLSIAILAGLLCILVVLTVSGVWKISDKLGVVLIGISLFSLLPVLLALIDVLIESGGSVRFRGLEINFAQVSHLGMSGFTVPTNIGVPSQYVGDSSTTEILDALRQAAACEVVVIDLEDGQAWWETRLLVLLAGAVRLERPHKVVFIGKDAGVEGCFQGWGYSVKLLPYLLKAHPQYLRSYHAAQAAARQWELVEPENPPDPINPSTVPPKPLSIQSGLANMHPWMAFDSATGLPNPLLAEQLLADDLGQQIERREGPRTISLFRLNEIFQPVLYKAAIDTNWPTERQITEFFDCDFDHLAIIQKGKYLSLTSKISVLNVFVRDMVERNRA